MSLKLLQKY